jgi:hypothetical protein
LRFGALTYAGLLELAVVPEPESGMVETTHPKSAYPQSTTSTATTAYAAAVDRRDPRFDRKSGVNDVDEEDVFTGRATWFSGLAVNGRGVPVDGSALAAFVGPEST